MKTFLLLILAIPFLYINYKIIVSDYKESKIPNKYLKQLLFLLPCFFIYFLFYYEVNYLFFVLQIITTLLISFVLYYLGIWSAGDAKYLLVLSLFIPNIGVISFVGNIALITVIYLFLYFIYFYFGKCIIHREYGRCLYRNIYTDLKDKTITFIKHSDGNFYIKTVFLKTLRLVLFFLIIFVTIRLTRMYILASIRKDESYHEFTSYFANYSVHIFLGIIVFVFFCFYLIRWGVNKLRNTIEKKMGTKSVYIFDGILISVLLIFLLIFISYEYSKDPIETKIHLIRIFTICIWFYFLFKVLRYGYKITFETSEEDIIDIKDLKTGDIVEKKYLVTLLGSQKCLGFEQAEGLLAPNPKDYFLRITNPIDEETKDTLQKAYKITEAYHSTENKNGKYMANTSIKILKTFAFGGYIFCGFLLSLLVGDSIYRNVVGALLKATNLLP